MTEVSEAWTSPLLQRLGAVAAVGDNAGVAAHYGNPFAEQRMLAQGGVIVDLSQRAVLSITGADRLSWLDAITSQSLAKLAPGGSAEALLLSQTGRIEHVLKVLDDGVTTWLLIEAEEADALHAWLESMRFMMRVEISNRTEEFATLGVIGALPEGLFPAEPNSVALIWNDPWSALVSGGHQYATAGTHPGASWDWREFLVERSVLGELDGVPAAGFLALEALRIAAWRPRFGTEVDEKSIPHELDWLRSAVHLSKGCYRGQETVAKVHNLGHPPRRLVLLHLDGSDDVLPAPGDEVFAPGRDGIPAAVGKITSSARHFEFGPIALAVIKRTTDAEIALAVAAGDTLVAAAQEVIVPPTAGATAEVPRLPRLGGGMRV